MLKLIFFGVLMAAAGGALIWVLVATNGGEECTAVKDAVKNLRYIELNNGNLKLEWDPPDIKNLQKYVISIWSNLNNRSFTYDTKETSYTFVNIASCTSYMFTVSANAAPTYNVRSITLMVHTHETTVENPKNVTIDIKNQVVQWTPSSDNCIRGYHLKFFHSDMCIKDITLPRSTSSYEFRDLTACAQYMVTFRTLGSNLTHSPGLIRKEVSPILADLQSMDVIQNLHFKILSLDKIVLEWDSASVALNCIYDYAISIPNYRSFPLMTTRNVAFNISGLNACMEYQIIVTARTVYKEYIGKSAELLVKTSSLENQIENLSFTETNGNLIVKWNAPVTTVDCVELYTLDICAIDANIACHTYKPNIEVMGAGMVVHVPDIVPCVTYKVSMSVMSTDRHNAFYSEIYQSQPRVFAAPVFRSIHNITSHSAVLRWGIREPAKNRCKLSSSILECTIDGNSFMSYEFVANQTQEIVTEVQNLIPYANYSCYLTFSQVVGRSEKSREVQFITSEDAPSAIRNLSVTNIRSNGFSITWEAPKLANGVLKAYQIQVKSVGRLYETPTWCTIENGEPMKTTLSANIMSYEVENLNPSEEYRIMVTAATGIGFGSSAEMTVATLPAAPEAVSQSQYTPASSFSYMVTWKQPCRCNGVLKLFRVMVTGTRDKHLDDTFSYSVMPNTSYPDAVYSVRLPKLRPVYHYKIEIAASVENVLEFGAATVIEMSTPPSLPPAPHAEELVNKVRPVSVFGQNGTQYKVTLTKDMFEDSGGDVIYYALILGQDISLNNKMDSGSTNILKEWPLMSSWEEAARYDFVFPYQATPPYWNPFETLNPDESVEFVIGEDVFCEIPVGGFCNGPLKPETKYSMRIRAFTAAGYQDSPPVKFTTGSEIERVIQANYLLAVCVFLFLGFVVCGLYYVRTRHIPVFEQLTQRMNGRKKLTVVPSKCILIKRFPDLYTKLQLSPHILKMEFNELQGVSAKNSLSNDVANRYDNYRKNRYANVVPYDETRVKINGRYGDYINASFIEGFKDNKARYIACQGPLVETFTDFWTMILQYDINVVVMLCQIVENNKTVCDKYFPDVDQTLKFEGDINVECTMMTSNSLFEERKIIVTNKNKQLTVSHIKFLEWPDFDIPSDPEILVNFCNAVRKLWNDKPIVVHCSAGVGRTGTFIACDILLQQLHKNKFVNIFDTVLQLRKQRPGMVQSVAQYTYLYDCVFNGIKRLNKIPKNNKSVKS